MKTPDLLEASLQLRSPAVGAEAEGDGERLARLSLPGLWRLGRGLGAATPGEDGGESGSYTRPRGPGTQEPTLGPAARTCRPARRP